jgi:hypothetical protein
MQVAGTIWMSAGPCGVTGVKCGIILRTDADPLNASHAESKPPIVDNSRSTTN